MGFDLHRMRSEWTQRNIMRIGPRIVTRNERSLFWLLSGCNMHQVIFHVKCGRTSVNISNIFTLFLRFQDISPHRAIKTKIVSFKV